jgi:hypothetical protein
VVDPKMMRADALHRLADVAAVLVEETDLAGALVRIVAEATAAAGADAGGLLVLNSADELELLSATSHRAADLEAWQVGAGFGPCVACMEEVSTVSATAVEAAEVWPEFAEQMTTAGYRYVLATPLRWQGAALGGLNLFWHEELSTDAETSLTVAQAFADALTLGVLAVRPVSVQEARTRLNDALRGRVVIERAKGVLAHEHQLSMEAAFERLLEISEERAEPLGRTAVQVVKRAQDGGRSSS